MGRENQVHPIHKSCIRIRNVSSLWLLLSRQTANVCRHWDISWMYSWLLLAIHLWCISHHFSSILYSGYHATNLSVVSFCIKLDIESYKHSLRQMSSTSPPDSMTFHQHALDGSPACYCNYCCLHKWSYNNMKSWTKNSVSTFCSQQYCYHSVASSYYQLTHHSKWTESQENNHFCYFNYHSEVKNKKTNENGLN